MPGVEKKMKVKGHIIMPNGPMKMSRLDEDFENVLKLLNENGFKPYASCDGVKEHHNIDEWGEVLSAYIAFLKSEKIIDLMSVLMRDELFCIDVATPTSSIPRHLYGNLIKGITYATYFKNSQGEYTKYFEKIVKGVIDGSIVATDEEKRNMQELSKVLESDKDSDISIDVGMIKGKYRFLRISTKNHSGTRLTKERDMCALADILNDRYTVNCPFKVTSSCANYVYINCSNADKNVLDEIKYIREVGRGLPTFTPTYEEYYGDDGEL